MKSTLWWPTQPPFAPALHPWPLPDPPDPVREPGMGVAEALVLLEDAVEALVVLGLARQPVLEERVRAHVGRRELLAEQVRPPREQRLEAVERRAHLGRQRLDPLGRRLR